MNYTFFSKVCRYTRTGYALMFVTYFSRVKGFTGGQILAIEGGRVKIEVVAQNFTASIHSLRKENPCNPNLINTCIGYKKIIIIP